MESIIPQEKWIETVLLAGSTHCDGVVSVEREKEPPADCYRQVFVGTEFASKDPVPHPASTERARAFSFKAETCAVFVTLTISTAAFYYYLVAGFTCSLLSPPGPEPNHPETASVRPSR